MGLKGYKVGKSWEPVLESPGKWGHEPNTRPLPQWRASAAMEEGSRLGQAGLLCGPLPQTQLEEMHCALGPVLVKGL